MPRRRNESFLELMTRVPWCYSVILALLVYLFFEPLLLLLFGDHPVYGPFAQGFSQLTLGIVVLLLLPAPISFFKSRRNKRLLETQRSIDTIRQLSWRELEYLVAEAYRRQGYGVEENISSGADGGVDVCLRKAGKTYIVQCKQWKSEKVGVSVIREMFGIMVAEHADAVKVVSCGHFTQEAMKFAQGKPIELIDGVKLLSIVASVQHLSTNTATQPLPRTEGHTASTRNEARHEKLTPARVCPNCHSELVIRKARRGKNAGNDFYGCSSFPHCRYTESVH